MKKIIFTFLLFILTVPLNAQDFTKTFEDNSILISKEKKWFFEGTVSFTFGTKSYVGVTPLIGYKITPYVHTGASLSYFHMWDRTYPDNPTQSDVLGGSIIARWVPIKELFFQLEPAIYSYKVYSDITTYKNKGVPFLFLGAGYNYY